MQDTILIFGGGLLQLSIIDKAKLMGFKTIVIDPDGNAPAKKTADLFIQVAGDDFIKTRQIAFDYKIKGILTAATDKPILMMCHIAKEFNLPFPTYESCKTVLDKAKFKIFLERNKLAYAKGNEFKGVIDITKLNLNFPIIIKPVMNSGSRGVIKCDHVDELIVAIKETLMHCKDDRYLIEEFIDGDEISVEALVQNNGVKVLQITDKILTLPPYNVELGHIQPSKYIYLKHEIEQLLQTVVNGTGLNNCALHPEMKIKDNQLTIIEIGPRLGGDFITSHLVPLSTSVNMEEQLIRIAVGLSVEYNTEYKASMVSYLDFPIGKKVIKTIAEEELKKLFPTIQEFNCNLEIGMKIKPITNSLNRYGQFVLAGVNKDSLLIQKEKITTFLKHHILTH